MKKIFLKIIPLFFLTILLASNILNLHAYLHQDKDSYGIVDSCHNNNDENEKDTPCELCLLAINFNDLDYTNTTEFSYENDIKIIRFNEEKKVIVNDLNYNQLFLNYNQNKAPPYFI